MAALRRASRAFLASLDACVAWTISGLAVLSVVGLAINETALALTAFGLLLIFVGICIADGSRDLARPRRSPR